MIFASPDFLSSVLDAGRLFGGLGAISRGKEAALACFGPGAAGSELEPMGSLPNYTLFGWFWAAFRVPIPEGRGYPGFWFGVGIPAIHIEPDVLPFKQTGPPSGSRLPGPKLPEGGTWLIVALLGFASIVFNLLPAQLSLWDLAVIQLSNILFLVGPEIYLALGVSDNEPCFCCICSLPSPPP